MDSSFLKFWGEFLLQAAAGQRSYEDVTRWVQSGFSPHVDLAALFRKCYGLAPPAASSPDDGWQAATSAFSDTLKAYGRLWGWVSQDEYDRLAAENKRLQARVDEQDRLIKRLEALLEDGDMGHLTIMARFQDLIVDQRKAFEELVQTLADPSNAPDKHQP
jgi:hypothetical protein